MDPCRVQTRVVPGSAVLHRTGTWHGQHIFVRASLFHMYLQFTSPKPSDYQVNFLPNRFQKSNLMGCVHSTSTTLCSWHAQTWKTSSHCMNSDSSAWKVKERQWQCGKKVVSIGQSLHAKSKQSTFVFVIATWPHSQSLETVSVCPVY